MFKTKLAIACVAAMLASSVAFAADDDAMHEAHRKMDKEMQAGMESSGSPEEKFVRMMIPHHQGAVDMSRLALPDIKDAELRRMVEKTMRENEREIKDMQAWLKKHGKS
jgi:uncharacterized protein (DUF305 family)